MRAIFQTTYGGTDVLQDGEVDDPKVGPDTVLVDVHAAGVNAVDTKIRAGHLQGAFEHVLPLVLGWDVSGVVSAVGPAVTTYAPGDEVIGYVRKDFVQGGTYAEQVAAWERHLARRPASVDHATAAALPLAGLTALQALEAAEVSSGDTVLVHAGAGGVGSFAVQLAAARGARVLATAGVDNHDHLRELGAEPLEYGAGLADRVREAATDGPDGPNGVDAALDLVGGDSIEVSAQVVGDRARSVSVVDPVAIAEQGGRYVFVRPATAQLEHLAALVDQRVLRVPVSGRFPLSDVASAHQRVEQGHVRGKLVLEVA